MISRSPFRRATAALLTGISLSAITLAASVTMPATPALAQSAEDFHVALESYGFWQQHPRFGEVWVPFGKPRGWRPYTVGRWLYTDEWGWYWTSEQDESDWGWITYHYGRWIFDRSLGWAWVPGDEWAPAWVNWRRSDAIVGWAPAPPEDVIYDYDDDPVYWTFVEPRYLTAPRVRTYFVPQPRVNIFIQQTVVVNRTFVSRGGARFAVNPGINPAFIAARSGRPLDTFNVRPRVLAGTAGVVGAVSIQAAQNRIPGAGPGNPGARRGPPGSRPAGSPALPPVQIQRAAAVQPAANIAAPQPLGRERGRLGNNPPRAAQGGAPVAPQAAPAAAPQAAPAAAPPAGGAPPPPRPASPPPSAPESVPPSVAPQAPGDRSRPFGPGERPQGERPQSAPSQNPAPAAPAARPNAEPAPAARPATPPPAAAPRPEARPEPRQEIRPEPRSEPRPPRPPQVERPVERPQAAPPRPAPPSPPPQARPAPPAPPAAAAPPPPRPAAPPPPPAAKPAPKPQEKPEEKK